MKKLILVFVLFIASCAPPSHVNSYQDGSGSTIKVLERYSDSPFGVTVFEVTEIGKTCVFASDHRGAGLSCFDSNGN